MAIFGQSKEVFAEHFATPNESYNAMSFILIGLLCVLLIWVVLRLHKEYGERDVHERDASSFTLVLRVIGLVAIIFAIFHG